MDRHPCQCQPPGFPWHGSRRGPGAASAGAAGGGSRIGAAPGVQARRASAGVMLAGVDAVQGYVLARPMTGEAAVAEACQAPGERAWYGHLDAARRLAAEVQSTGG